MQNAFTFGPFLVALVLVFTFVCRCGFSAKGRVGWCAVVFLACGKFLGFKIFGGKAFTPDLPCAVIWGWDAFYTAAFFLAALSILEFFWSSRRKRWVLPAASLALSVWGIYNGFRVPEVERLEIVSPLVPASLNGYRIVQISDLHCSRAAPRWRTEAVVKLANAEKANLICLTGDYVDGQVAAVGRDLEPLAELTAPDGVLAVTGNHEYYHDFYGWSTFYATKTPNIRFLTNACVSPRAGLVIGGTPDRTGYERHQDQKPDAEKAFASARPSDFRILLEHRPAKARRSLSRSHATLMLSGHTHGGVAPLFRKVVAALNGGFVRGLYKITDEASLYVNAGCGQWAGFPIRYFNPSEVTVITLHHR